MNAAFVPIESLRGPGPADGLATAAAAAQNGAATAPWMHLVSGSRPLVFVVDGSRLYEVSADLFAGLSSGDAHIICEFRQAVGEIGPGSGRSSGSKLAEPVSLSLNVAQACNLSCSYCYADHGRFGGTARMMEPEIAIAAIERLIVGAAGRRVTIGFIGGEPFLNRSLIHQCVDHAVERGRELETPVGFSVTTNGTLLGPADMELLRRHGFSVSVSLDGMGELNDRHRRSGQLKGMVRNSGPYGEARGQGQRRGATVGSSARAIEAIRPLLDDPGRARVAARVTVARDDLRVLERVEALADAGFREVGVSPLRKSADPELELRGEDWATFLAEMVRAGDVERDRVLGGGAWRFSNLAIALKELHRGSCRPLPCGAGNGYVSLSARGEYFSCHRAVDQEQYRLGSLTEGLDQAARQRFLEARHVEAQEPCRSCWARYLCGGGCHVEVIAAGRTGCDYIRGWLDYCLRFYDELLTERPDLFPPDGGKVSP
jgi:uncharacterized protein